MSIANVLSLLGGVALFLFGINLMSEGLGRVADNKLELILYRLSGTPLRAVLLGTGVTAVIQSSSATSAMVVGFVNSGMMKLKQAVNVIQGALIGTSITGWIICLSSIEGADGFVSIFSAATITAAAAVAGILLRMIPKKHTLRRLGDILLGFAVLMYGMQIMSGAVAPLKESPQFIHMMTTFSNPILGILVGAVFTAILQSASAATGILQALSVTGAMHFATAYPLLLGIAIGAALPVILSALGAKANAKRAAFSYLSMEVIGAILCAILYYALLEPLFPAIGEWLMSPVAIAAVNTVFRIIVTAVLLPFSRQLAALATLVIPESPDEESINKDLDRLDERFLQYPTLAVEQSHLTVNAMAKLARKNALVSFALMTDYSDSKKQSLEEREKRVDLFEDKLSSYFIALNSHGGLTPAQTASVSTYLHALGDFERISDHSVNIAELAEEINQKQLHFSTFARQEIGVIFQAVEEILDLSISAFEENDMEKAYLVEPLEERIDDLCDKVKMHHVDRLQQGICSMTESFVFNDLLTDCERMSDHCSNIAIAMIEFQSGSFDAHSVKARHDHDFDRHYEEYRKKYQV